jgi:hypothetical protein
MKYVKFFDTCNLKVSPRVPSENFIMNDAGIAKPVVVRRLCNPLAYFSNFDEHCEDIVSTMFVVDEMDRKFSMIRGASDTNEDRDLLQSDQYEREVISALSACNKDFIPMCLRNEAYLAELRNSTRSDVRQVCLVDRNVGMDSLLMLKAEYCNTFLSHTSGSRSNRCLRFAFLFAGDVAPNGVEDEVVFVRMVRECMRNMERRPCTLSVLVEYFHQLSINACSLNKKGATYFHLTFYNPLCALHEDWTNEDMRLVEAWYELLCVVDTWLRIKRDSSCLTAHLKSVVVTTSYFERKRKRVTRYEYG